MACWMLNGQLSRPNKSDWEKLRPSICDAYGRQHITARQICEHLRKDGFDVTEKMVKSHLAKWKVTKNKPMQPQHVRAVIRKSQRYIANGRQPPMFNVRGRKRTYEEAVQLAQKWSAEETAELARSRSPTPSDVEELHDNTQDEQYSQAEEQKL